MVQLSLSGLCKASGSLIYEPEPERKRGKMKPETGTRFAKGHADKWEILLQPYKVIKDPVHKDIWLTETETRIIDTPEFQRLRYIYQLGPAHMIYPGAKHTRFDHSLGTLFVAQKIIASIQRNADLYQNAERMEARDVVLTRLAALLHDAAHIPFGHLIEDEGRVIKEKQWENEFRMERLLGKESNIHKAIKKSLKSRRFSNKEIDGLIEDLKRILRYEEGGMLSPSFEKRYIADIVGNTICADLLDYVKRDIYFTGIFGQYDERLFTYFTLVNNGDKKVVIKLTKPNSDKLRYDTLSAILDLMRLRYSIAEKVYFHHTRQKLSAMIIEMIEAAFKAEMLNEEMLFDMNDDSLLKYIANYNNEEINGKNQKFIYIARNLANKILNRELYDEVFYVERWQYENKAETKREVDRLINNWNERFDLERFLEEKLDLDPGSIIIYAPPPKMGAKDEIHTEVEFDGDILPLHEMVEIKSQLNFIKEDINIIKRNHERLWNFKVFCDKIVGNKAEHIKSILGEWFIECEIGRDILSLVDGLEDDKIIECKELIKELMAAEMMPVDISRLRYLITTAEEMLLRKK